MGLHTLLTMQVTKKATVAPGFKAPGKELRPGSAQKRPASSLSGPAPSGSVGVEAAGHELKSSLDQPGAFNNSVASKSMVETDACNVLVLCSRVLCTWTVTFPHRPHCWV